eukprot:TRINITY_DN1486_c0_g2_i1.p1 TRINITY_DN1486_c0_g2~~TRINITY_DN1486_c0_g2_i1.p1  ORF type:complete len:498 (-),score=68.56 TRINITY_DN1486_c0_g2_i1:129-1622(-)
MRVVTPKIYWHGLKPIFTLDFQKGSPRLATSGEECDIKIWFISKNSLSAVDLEFRASLARHSKTVNVVRFSPNSELLASAADDGCINVWKFDSFVDPSKKDQTLDDDETKEVWTIVHAFGHVTAEYYDLSWAPDSQHFATGSTDNTIRIWTLNRASPVQDFRDHTHYVQGIAWDPKGEYLASQSADRSVRIYSLVTETKNQPLKFRFSHLIRHGALSQDSNQPQDLESPQKSEDPAKQFLFLDENATVYIRRLKWSPDGAYLVTPTAGTSEGNSTFVFQRHNFQRPMMKLSIPSASICVSFCPRAYNSLDGTKESEEKRLVYAIMSYRDVILYDTKYLHPLCLLSGMHSDILTDMSWSHEEDILAVSSIDGFITFLCLDQEDLGEGQQVAQADIGVNKRYIAAGGHKNKLNPKVSQHTSPFSSSSSSSIQEHQPFSPTILSPQTLAQTYVPSILKAQTPPKDPQLLVSPTSSSGAKRRITPVLVSEGRFEKMKKTSD